MLQPATSLDDVYKTLSPEPLLTPEQVRAFYSDRLNTVRGDDKGARLALALNRAFGGSYYKAFLMGHPGVGKSTELTRLIQRISDKYRAIRFSATSALDPASFKPFDVQLLMMAEVAEETAKPKKQGGTGQKPSDARLKEIWEWFAAETKTLTEITHIGAEATAGAGVPGDTWWAKALGLFGTLVERFERALAVGVPVKELRQNLAIPAVHALLEGGAEKEARALALTLAQKFIHAGPPPSEETLQKDFFISYNHADRQWAERAVRAVSHVFPHVAFSAWPRCERLLPQALACVEITKRWALEFQEAATLINEAGRYLYERARFAEAALLLQRSLEIYEKVLGPEHPYVAASLNNLAAIYEVQGRYTEAEPLFQRALEIDEKTQGSEHPNVAIDLNNLAGLYESQGRYVEAESLYQRALAVREKVLGPEHPSVANSLNDLAQLYHIQGQKVKAESLYQRALAIKEKTLESGHPSLATTLDNLSEVYKSQGKYDQAEPLLQRALEIREEALGQNHPSVASSLNNLAGLYKALGKVAQAESLLQRALEINRKALGPEHPGVATSFSNLAALYGAQGKYTEAEPFCQQAIVIREKALGPDHPHVATSLHGLAQLYHAQGMYAEAEPLYQRALVILENSLGSDHPNFVTCLENLPPCYDRQTGNPKRNN